MEVQESGVIGWAFGEEGDVSAILVMQQGESTCQLGELPAPRNIPKRFQKTPKSKVLHQIRIIL
jgi:hypothetical protein